MSGTPDLPETFTRALSTVSRRWRRRLDTQFRGLGLSQARWRVILELSRHDEITQIELARTLGVEGPTLVRLLDALEAAGLVERQPSTEDRRAKKLRLTPAALPLLARMKAIAAVHRADLLSDISPDDLQVAARVLGQIAARLERMGDGENG